MGRLPVKGLTSGSTFLGSVDRILGGGAVFPVPIFGVNQHEWVADREKNAHAAGVNGRAANPCSCGSCPTPTPGVLLHFF